ncbi:hypothetical protein L195_g059046, partial [Trifolium pratense]
MWWGSFSTSFSSDAGPVVVAICFVVSSPDLDFDLGSVSLRLSVVIKCNLLALKDWTHGFPLICLLVLFYSWFCNSRVLAME